MIKLFFGGFFSGVVKDCACLKCHVLIKFPLHLLPWLVDDLFVIVNLILVTSVVVKIKILTFVVVKINILTSN